MYSMKKNLNRNVASGIEYALVANIEDKYVKLSIQKVNKNIKDPKIAICVKFKNFDKFKKLISKELENNSSPKGNTIATLYCIYGCEILKLIKIGDRQYEARMYYSYRRPRNKNFADSVALTAVDLEKFLI